MRRKQEMVKSYEDFFNNSNNNNSDNYRPNTNNADGEKEKKSVNLDVWEEIPSYKDVNKRESILKTGSLVVIGLLFFICSLYATYNLELSIIVTLIVAISFIAVFRKKIFSLRHVLDFQPFKPFGDFVFWQSVDVKSVLYFTNRKELNTTGFRAYRIKILPENVQESSNWFYVGLQKLKVPFSYQVIQKPLQTIINSDGSTSSTFETIVYFGTFSSFKGRITKSKLKKVVYELNRYMTSLKTSIVSNFHHFKFVELSGEALLRAYRIAVLKQDVEIEKDAKKIVTKTQEPKTLSTMLKASYVLGLVICIDRLLLTFSLPVLAQTLAFIAILTAILLIWWRDLFFFLIKNRLFESNAIQIVDPLSEIDFFKVSEAPDTIFYQVEGKMTGGIKINNLYFASPRPFCIPSKFYAALNHEKMPYTATIQLNPLDFDELEKEGFKHLKEVEKQKLLRNTKRTVDGTNWLNLRSGIWRPIITYSTSALSEATSLNYEVVDEIERKLRDQILVLEDSFGLNFINYKLKPLRKNELESGLLFETFKNNLFRRNGTHLSYLLLQGKTLLPITEISNQFKKGIETRIAAEFNTPLYLTNLITVGHTINTEFLENEVPMGFTLEQLQNLLIVNGANSSREALCQKIVVELVKEEFPSIIFDFTGNWSKLIRFFEGTIYEERFLHLKAGKTFLVNPLFSEIPYDLDNIGYLDYMFDAFGLCFKKDERIIEGFKSTLARNTNVEGSTLDISTISLDLTTKSDWEKSPITDSMVSFFNEFTEQDKDFMQRQPLDNQEIIPSYELITQDKTVIIDFSDVINYEKKCFFTFVVLSKFIHYLRTGKSYYPKFLIVPHLGVVFDGFFIDKKVNYGIIDKFLEPFAQKGFGAICSVSQIRHLHSNAFNYFENIVTFKATDNRDSAVLKAQMNLEALHGQGYYSRSRNEGYQIRYISSMKKNEAVVKREDIYQPFPVEFDLKEIRETIPLSWEEIIAHMGKQGYNLEKTEKLIIQRAKKTLFQKDFGDYSALIEGIIKFLNNLKMLDQVGNLYEQKVKKELTQWLHPYILKITKDKKREKEIKNKTFEILVKQRYLIESHPRRASGSESLQTSFAVGPHYDEALKDFYEAQSNAEISYEPIDVESESFDNLDNFDNVNNSNNSNNSVNSVNSYDFDNSSRTLKIKAKKLKKAFTEHFARIFYYEHFKMYQAIKDGNFKKSLKIGKNLLKKFLHATYNSYYSVNYAITSADIDRFTGLMSKIEDFPFVNGELKDFLSTCENLSFEEEGVEMRCRENFEAYSKVFDGFKRYIEGDMRVR